MADYLYLATPFVTWFIAGSLKFAIHSIRTGSPSSHVVGYGGMPSNHSAIVSSMVTLIALQEGMSHPSFGVAVTFGFIVLLDASTLRRQVGKQAAVINSLKGDKALRERMGHSRLEIVAGLLTGSGVATALFFIFA